MGQHCAWDRDIEILCLKADKGNLWAVISQLDAQAKVFQTMITMRDRELARQGLLVEKLRELVKRQDEEIERLKGLYVNEQMERATAASRAKEAVAFSGQIPDGPGGTAVR